MSVDADEIARVLSEHGQIGYDDIEGCECGADIGWGTERYNVHLAQALAPLVEQARQEGAREALTEFADRFRPGDGNPWALHVRARARRAAERAARTPGIGTAGGGS